MRISYLQHAPHVGPAAIADWAETRGFTLSGCHLYRDGQPPEPEAADALAVLGGPMGVHDEAAHPWLLAEKALLWRWVDAGKPVLGTCLGAQLIAQVLGAEVGPNRQPEIGWWPIRLQPGTPLAALLPAELEAFHWHRDTFALPPGALPLATSAACANQGFVWGGRVLGLQPHLEMDMSTARAIIAHSGHTASAAPYVQSAAAILALPQRFTALRHRFYAVLDCWAAGA